MHIWYKANGERSRNLRGSEGLPVDVKGSGGNGGFIVVPLSLRFGGSHAGKQYSFERGGWDDLPRLGIIRPGSPPEPAFLLGPSSTRATATTNAAAVVVAEVGERNNTLFRELISRARGCVSVEDLLGEASHINRGFPTPLQDEEVNQAVRNVWRYLETGRLFDRGTSSIVIREDQLLAFGGQADAFLLYAHLLASHAARSEPFAISDKAMSEAEVIPGWGRARYRSARKELVSCRRLEQVRKGGSRPGDPSLYVFATRVRQVDTI